MAEVFPQLDDPTLAADFTAALATLSAGRRRSWLWLAGVVAGVGIAIVAIAALDGHWAAWLGSAVAIIVPLSMTVHVRSVAAMGVRNLLLERVVPAIARHISPGLEFCAEEGFSLEQFVSIGPDRGRIDEFCSDCLFTGTIDGVRVSFARVLARRREQRRGVRGQTRTVWVTLFSGVLFHGDFQKEFHHPLWVQPDFAERHFGQLLGNFFQKCASYGSLRMMRMENPDFEKQFVVYAEDALETRYVLSPKMMENLMAVGARFDRQAEFSFRDSAVWVVLPDDVVPRWLDLDAAMNPEGPAHLLQDVETVARLSRDLDLHVRLWSKE